MALVSSNVSLETYNGSQSQKSYNNVRRMLSMVYFHCKKIRNAENITANFEKSCSKISHFRLQKSEKSPAKSRRDCLIKNNNDSIFCFSLKKWKVYRYKQNRQLSFLVKSDTKIANLKVKVKEHEKRISCSQNLNQILMKRTGWMLNTFITYIYKLW